MKKNIFCKIKLALKTFLSKTETFQALLCGKKKDEIARWQDKIFHPRISGWSNF